MRRFKSWLCLITLVWGISPAIQAQSKERYVFALTEGGSSRIVGKDIPARYKELMQELSVVLKKPVILESVLDYKQLAAGLAAERYDLAFIHPTQIAMAAVNSKKYRHLGSEKYHLDYQVQFFVTKDSPLKALADLKDARIRDKTIVLPMEYSVTSAIAKTMITELLGEFKHVTYTNQEDALPFATENGAIELESMLFLMKSGLGAVAASASLGVVNDWKANGGRVIGISPKMPVKHLIANNRFTDAEKTALATFFLNLDKTDTGRKRLQQLGYSGFVAMEPAKLDALVNWFNR